MIRRATADGLPLIPTDQEENLTDLPHRAIAAARAADAVLGGGRAPDDGWYARAAHATRTLATTLGIDPGIVVARPDPIRGRGRPGAGEVQLAVIQTLAGADLASSEDLFFIPDVARDDAFLWLLPCSDCHQLVPTYRVASLVDLGRHFDWETSSSSEPDTSQFATDPAHFRQCHRRHDRDLQEVRSLR